MKRKNIILLSLISVITMFNAAFYWSIKPIWFFIDKELEGFLGMDRFLSLLIWVLLLGASAYAIGILFISLIRVDPVRGRRYKVHAGFLILLNITFSALNYYLYTMLGSEKHIIVRNLSKLLPGGIIVALILFFVIVFPKLKLSRNIKTSGAVAGFILISLAVYNMDMGIVKFTSGPYIQYVDDDNLAVIWTTDKNSSGWIEYGINEDELSKTFMSDDGLIQGNTKIHKVVISSHQEAGMNFRAGSASIKDYFQNNIVYGNTVYSDFIKFENDKDDQNISFYVLSDIHENKDIYYKYLLNEDYNFLVLNGDILSSIDNEKIIIDEMLKPITNTTEGLKPFYFVRGNHELRGASSRELPNYLALPNESYYYTFNYGPIFAIVLDSGEDKPDSHEEYGGLVDFEAYRSIETKWLREIAKSEAYKNAKFKIAFSHVPLNMYASEDEDSPLKAYEDEWVEILNSMEIDALFSGHTHVSDLIEVDGDSYDFPIIVGGGYHDGDISYEGIRVEVENNTMKVYFVDEEGKTTKEYTLETIN